MVPHDFKRFFIEDFRKSETINVRKKPIEIDIRAQVLNHWLSKFKLKKYDVYETKNLKASNKNFQEHLLISRDWNSCNKSEED